MAISDSETQLEKKRLVEEKISRILDDVRSSNASSHARKLKELSSVRSSSSSSLDFFSAFSKCITPLFNYSRQLASSERVVRFLAAFATTRNPNSQPQCDEFLDHFLRFLLFATAAANKTVRFRSCQIISEIIMRLPDDTEVSDELWDEVIECLKLRLTDKVASVRTFAIRALSRFATDSGNSDVLELFLQALSLEQNADVRKAIVLSLPPSNATSAVVIDCTLDVSEYVRKAAYRVLAEKFPLQSLSIKLRTTILQRGLSDRSVAVTKGCLKLLKDEWLVKCCKGDPIQLLKYLDVETYETVGVSVMEALLQAQLVRVENGESIQQFIVSDTGNTRGDSGYSKPSIQLMEPEVALYWRTVCCHLQREAQEKGSDAAATTGTEATVYASEASDKNDLLEHVLPVSVSDYVELVKAHLIAGQNFHFASRQLLLLGEMLDFSDSTNRKVARAFLEQLFLTPLEHEVDDIENKIIVGDGINLGGDRDWANAVSGLAKKVHSAVGEFEEVVLGVLEELARPCRERAADFMQWMHCLALTGLLLEKAKSYQLLEGKAIEPAEILHSLLLPGAKHVHLDVQRVAVRCLGLFGLLTRKPSEELIMQLRLSFIKGSSPIRVVACKALMDIGLWHGPHEIDRLMRTELSSSPINLDETDDNSKIEMLDLLFDGFEMNDWSITASSNEDETVLSVLGEGFAKILLLGENYPSIPGSLRISILTKLIKLYFSDEVKYLKRLKQCLSVFFEHYTSLSPNHKKYLSKSFIPVMSSMWPALDGSPGGSSVVVSNMRKRASQASRFMLQMMQAPLLTKEIEPQNTNDGKPKDTIDGSLECGDEGLAIQIAAEVLRFPRKKSPAEKSYVVALCKILVLLQFQPSEQGAIKLTRKLLQLVAVSISTEKEVAKELKSLAQRLKALDRQPDEDLKEDEAKAILGRLEVEVELDEFDPMAIPQTPVPPSTTRSVRSRRRVRHDETSSGEERSPILTSVVRNELSVMSTRSQRASKTAALSKIAANLQGIKITEEDEDGSSDVTSEDESDESEQSME